MRGRRALGEPTLSEEEEEMHAGWESERAEQQEIFEAGREEILAAHPGKHIAVCEGEVLVAGTATGVDNMVMREHPGRTTFFYSPGCTCVTMFGLVGWRR